MKTIIFLLLLSAISKLSFAQDGKIIEQTPVAYSVRGFAAIYILFHHVFARGLFLFEKDISFYLDSDEKQ